MADEPETPVAEEPETTETPEESGVEKERGADYYREQLRQYERNAKKSSAADKKKIADLEAKLSEREEADKTEQEKALDAARKEAQEQARSAVLTELREERLEVAVARLANGITIKDGDEEKTVRFADPDDAIVHIERAIKAGDVDSDDIFDDNGKVQTDALTTALEDLLTRKPHLQASNGAVRSKGDPDAGKGAGGSKSMEDLSVEEHLARKQKDRA